MALDQGRKCPACGSNWVFEEKRGFNLKAFLLGTVGLIGAVIEANKTHFICKECGKTWIEEK